MQPPLPELASREASTQNNHNTALSCWNNLFSPRAGCPTVEHLTPQYMTARNSADDERPKIHVLFRQYGQFVLNLKKNATEYYKFGAIKQRVCGVHTYLFQKFPSCNVLNKDHPCGQWYSTAFHNLMRTHSANVWKRGGSIKQQNKGMREDDVGAMVDELATTGTAESIRLISMALLLYYFCGRAGELGLVTLHSCCWLNGEFFYTLPNPKTGGEQQLDIYPHYSNPLLDHFYWIATYMICHTCDFAGRNADGAWLFPTLRQYYEGNDSARKNKVSQAITNLLDRLLSDTFKGKSACTSHTFRHGATDDMILNQSGRDNCAVLIGAIYRGGWDFSRDCEIFNYLFKRLFITQSGKAIAGYPNARMSVAMPTLQPILDVCDSPEEGTFVYASVVPPR